MSSIRQIVDSKIIKILDLVLKNSDQIYHLQKISTDAKVPLGTTHRLVQKLVKVNFLTVINVGKTKLYKLNSDKKKELEALAK